MNVEFHNLHLHRQYRRYRYDIDIDIVDNDFTYVRSNDMLIHLSIYVVIEITKKSKSVLCLDI